ncbi:MAG: tetratricopeptide repeat protein [Acidobacteria bacterium]|nr:tetratricopeptide repeat protein [Acidobacteriota bacterium]
MNSAILLLVFTAGVLVTAIVASVAHRVRPRARPHGPYRTLVTSALASMAGDDHRSAAAALREAIELRGDDEVLYLLLAEELLRSADPARAERAADVLLTLSSLNANLHAAALLLKGRACEQTGRPEEAEALYEKAAAAQPRSGAPLVALERLLSRRGRWREAIAISERMARVAPERARVVTARRRVLLAREQLAEGNTAGALAQADAALAALPEMGAAHLTRGDALFQEGRPREARASWHEAARRAPQLAPLVLERLEALAAGTHELDGARAFAAEAVEREGSPQATARLAAWLAADALRRGATGEARAWSERVERAAPRSATAARAEARLAASEDGRAAGARLSAVLSRWERERPWWDVWRCQRCGKESDEFEWRCPACQGWETLA